MCLFVECFTVVSVLFLNLRWSKKKSLIMNLFNTGLTKCQKDYAKAISKPRLVGIFIPHCRQDGSFSPMQCHASTGFCWCVTQDGKKVPNSDTRGDPNCKFLRVFFLCVLKSKDWLQACFQVPSVKRGVKYVAGL